MRKFNRFFSIESALLALSSLILSTSLLAKDITLYDQPNANAKAVGKVDLATGVMPIFKPTASDWVKVADPKNGNVGWVKASELNANGTVSFTQRVITSDKAPQTFQLIINGQPQNLTREQSELMLQKMQTQQINMMQYIQSMVDDMNGYFKKQSQLIKINFPVEQNTTLQEQKPTVINPVIPTPTPKK